MKKYFLLAIIFVFLTGCTSTTDVDNKKTENNQEVEKNDEVVVSDEGENVEVEESQEIISDNIKISGISAGDTLVSPALIEGETGVDGVIVELRNSEHEAVVSVPAKVYDNKFKISEYWFKFKNTKEGYLAVFEQGDKDNITEIPVKFESKE